MPSKIVGGSFYQIKTQLSKINPSRSEIRTFLFLPDTSDPESGIRNSESALRQAQGPFRNQESGIRNPESGIRNPESEINNYI